MINSSNIEEKLFLLWEGLLEAEEVKAVEEYLARHPEAHELQALYDPQLTLPKDLYAQDAVFPNKESLKHHSARTIPLEQPNSINAGQKGGKEHWLQRLPLGKSYAAAACAIALLVTGIFLIINGGDSGSSSGTLIAWQQDDSANIASTFPGQENVSDPQEIEQIDGVESSTPFRNPKGKKNNILRKSFKNLLSSDLEGIRMAQKNSEQTQYSVVHSASPSLLEGQQEEDQKLAAEAQMQQQSQVEIRNDLIEYRNDLIAYGEEADYEASEIVQSKKLIYYHTADTTRVLDSDCSGLLCWLGITPMLEKKRERNQQLLASIEEGWNDYWSERTHRFVRRRY